MTHTPGPWECVMVGPGVWGDPSTHYQIVEQVGYDIADIAIRPTSLNNAALIAAAPELLEACKAALSELEQANSVANDAYDECDGATQAMLIKMLPEPEDSAIPKLITAITSAEPVQ